MSKKQHIARGAFLSGFAIALVACGGGDGGQDKSVGGPPDTTRLIGTVTYREKAALPPDATVEVRLEESAKGAASPTTVDGTTFGAAGRQVPLPFTLEFNRDLLKKEHTYALRATIRSKSGDALYASSDDQPQLLNPNTTARIELVVQPVGASTAPH